MFRYAFIPIVVLSMGFTGCATPPRNPSPGQVWKDPDSGMDYCYCPPGTFLMGSVEGEPYHTTDQKPRHPVTITQGFWMGRTEVTTAQWRATMGGLPSSMEPGAFPEDLADGPVTMVTWYDCQDFLRKLNPQMGRVIYRLPTEAEWEYACQAGSSTVTDYGYELECGRAEVRNRPNAWGLVHMLGHVRQWCSDWMGRYPSASAIDPQGPESGTYRINRGGSFSEKPFRIYPTFRWYYTPDFRDNDLGFRVVRVAE